MPLPSAEISELLPHVKSSVALIVSRGTFFYKLKAMWEEAGAVI